jgi:hypothetical protein
MKKQTLAIGGKPFKITKAMLKNVSQAVILVVAVVVSDAVGAC